MAGLFKYFQRQSLPRSRETGLVEVLTKEANTAVKFWRGAKWNRRLKMQVHTFHTRAKSEDRHVCSWMWQHSECKTLQQRVYHPWGKYSKTIQKRLWSRAQEKGSGTWNFSPNKEEVRKTTHSWRSGWESSAVSQSTEKSWGSCQC